VKPDLSNALRLAISLGRERWLDKESLESIERKKLGWILRSASRTPYYGRLFSDLGISLAEISQDLSVVPITEKDTLRKTPREFLTSEASSKPLFSMHTSGSTGKPAEIFMDTQAMDHRAALGVLSMHEMGRRPTDHFAEIARIDAPMSPHLQSMGIYRKTFLSVFDSEARLFAKLRTIKADVMGWYPSMSHSLALENNRQGNPLRFRNVFSSGEVLSSEARKAIEDSFSCRVMEQYASAEFSTMAWECPEERSLHVGNGSFVFEVLDEKGKPKKSGIGGLAVTCLSNHAMPLLRYRIGDMASWGDDCPCGRGAPVLRSIVGRSDDGIILPSGTLRNSFCFNIMYYGGMIQGVWSYQIIQEREDLLVFRYVPSPGGLSESWKAELLRRFDMACLGESVKVEFEEVASLPRDGSGKVRAIISKVIPRHI
jgi:phenylacetate-CoA ligase